MLFIRPRRPLMRAAMIGGIGYAGHAAGRAWRIAPLEDRQALAPPPSGASAPGG
jgi:hypothetical protein